MFRKQTALGMVFAASLLFHAAVFSDDLPKTQVITAANAKQVAQLVALSPAPDNLPLPVAVESVAFSPDGKTFAYGMDNYKAEIRDVETQALISSFEDPGEYIAESVAFSPDGSTLAVGETSGQAVKLWDIQTGTETRTLDDLSFSLFSVAYSLDGTKLVVGGGDGDVWLLVAATGKTLAKLEGATNIVPKVLITPDGKGFGALSWDGSLPLWDFDTAAAGKARLSIQLPPQEPGYGAAISPDGSIIAVGGQGKLFFWSAKTGKQMKTYTLPKAKEGEYQAWGMQFSPDGSVLAMAMVADEPSPVVLWDVKTGKEIIALDGHQDSVLSVAFSPDGTLLASSSSDGTVRLWGVKDGA